MVKGSYDPQPVLVQKSRHVAALAEKPTAGRERGREGGREGGRKGERGRRHEPWDLLLAS